ncbi:MAG: GntR family transcriptional regulator [Clostridiales bacterium]|uniref:GntR family transcriptional regulator n=1 Tax=Clostridium sp. N3C TaxID=1776758 RepID=UPI00092E09BD|nr:GntR family transcriptional regulator [Clostridium sp. N3C]NLZ49431.1 GntR family transcriptional regulator [Clostridiales bacterium]SCN25182.1 putative HTH-type transcriptional regulator YdfH [Clostridium sp. N3C]
MDEQTRPSMEQLVYNKLKDSILHRQLAPGTQLVESTISERLQVSRTPIRNAIKKLASEGLINIIANRGAFVIQPSLDEITQAYEARIELECVAAKLSIERIRKEDISTLRLLVDDERKAFKEKDMDKFIRANENFHMTLVKKSNNKFLIEFMQKLVNQINVYLKLFDTFYKVNFEEHDSIKEHLHIIDLIEKKDYEQLDKSLRQHISHSFEDLEINTNSYKKLKDIF